MAKKPSENKRERYFATRNEQNLINSLRQHGSVPVVNEGITKAILFQMEQLERRMDYLKQEGMELSPEYEEIILSYGPLQMVFLNWRELAKEYRGEK